MTYKLDLDSELSRCQISRSRLFSSKVCILSHSWVTAIPEPLENITDDHHNVMMCRVKTLERSQSRPHWFLLIYSFQFRSAFHAWACVNHAQPATPTVTDNLAVLIIAMIHEYIACVQLKQCHHSHWYKHQSERCDNDNYVNYTNNTSSKYRLGQKK